MTRSRALSTAVLAVGTAAVLGFCWSPQRLEDPIQTAKERSPPSAAPPRDEAVKSELAVLRAELAALRREIAAKPAPQPEIEKEQRTEAEARADAEADRQERIAAAESAFRAESSEGHWASVTGLAIRGALDDSGIALRIVRDVECRSRTCRVELADGASGELASSLTRFVLRVAAILPSTFAQQISEGAGSRTVLYLSAGG